MPQNNLVMQDKKIRRKEFDCKFPAAEQPQS
jgi:hypothetical protein